MTNHTPGPWRVGKKYPADVVSEDGRITVARIHHQSAAWSSEVVANATLIAAAPELLEALQQAEMAMAGYMHRNDVIDAALVKARAAIAKATGETQ